MSVDVKIPAQLRELVGGENVLKVDDAANLRELLQAMGEEHPQLTERIMDEGGDLRRFINVYVGDEDVRFLDGLDTKIPSGETVSILPAVAGG